MKYKIGDIVQIVKVNKHTDLRDNPDLYIGQTVEIIDISDSYKEYPFVVKFDENFEGNRDRILWSEDELDYPSNNINVKIIWNKLIPIVDDIKNLKETPDDGLKAIFYLIEEYKRNNK